MPAESDASVLTVSGTIPDESTDTHCSIPIASSGHEDDIRHDVNGCTAPLKKNHGDPIPKCFDPEKTKNVFVGEAPICITTDDI